MTHNSEIKKILEQIFDTYSDNLKNMFGYPNWWAETPLFLNKIDKASAEKLLPLLKKLPDLDEKVENQGFSKNFFYAHVLSQRTKEKDVEVLSTIKLWYEREDKRVLRTINEIINELEQIISNQTSSFWGERHDTLWKEMEDEEKEKSQPQIEITSWQEKMIELTLNQQTNQEEDTAYLFGRADTPQFKSRRISNEINKSGSTHRSSGSSVLSIRTKKGFEVRITALEDENKQLKEVLEKQTEVIKQKESSEKQLEDRLSKLEKLVNQLLSAEKDDNISECQIEVPPKS
jgi:hypothetical protein